MCSCAGEAAGAGDRLGEPEGTKRLSSPAGLCSVVLPGGTKHPARDCSLHLVVAPHQLPAVPGSSGVPGGSSPALMMGNLGAQHPLPQGQVPGVAAAAWGPVGREPQELLLHPRVSVEDAARAWGRTDLLAATGTPTPLKTKTSYSNLAHQGTGQGWGWLCSRSPRGASAQESHDKRHEDAAEMLSRAAATKC